MSTPIDPTLDPLEPRTATPFDIIRIASATLGVTDLERSRNFYVDALGFIVTHETPTELWLRGLEETSHHSLVLRVAPEPLVQRLGFRVWADDHLDALEAHFASLGCRVVHSAAGEQPGLGRSLQVEDRLGYPLEFFHEVEAVPRLLQRYDLYSGARIMRMDHVNIQLPDPQAAQAEYRALGFRTTELISDGPDGKVYAAWMTRKPTVHDVAITAGGGPRVHHVAFTVADAGALTHACDVLGGLHLERHIERGPGRHGVTNAHYLYLRDPDGHRIELYVGDYYTGDPDLRPLRWDVTDDRRRSFWGHHVDARWYEESSPVADLDGSAVPVTMLPNEERIIAEQLAVG
ncbi:MAG TPA: 3,4-dihydroxyphenylacetate 2,3-dioxygenase [Baekduia sp.]|nr:3,4-dihydroxyphenylacetate 2,3-dioxygenase [Baekduia sp.]